MECFFLYRYNEKKLKVLYSAAKDRIPNAIISTCFKKHFHEILNKRWHNEEFSTVLFYIPSITDWKEKINQHRDNVNLNPIDYSLDYLNSFSPDKEVSFRPDLLNSADVELRSRQVKLLYQFFRNMAETSNANLIRSADQDMDNSNIVWVWPTKQYFDTTKFNLTY